VRRYDRGGYRRPSPRRSCSPGDQSRRDLSDTLHSGRGAGGSNRCSSSPPCQPRKVEVPFEEP
jgi:peptidyl-prolyl isomerase G (cyclophilin G)